MVNARPDEILSNQGEDALNPEPWNVTPEPYTAHPTAFIRSHDRDISPCQGEDVTRVFVPGSGRDPFFFFISTLKPRVE